MDPNTPAPAPPVHAARLSALLKSLASAEGAVSESIKARRDLLGGLEKLLETNRTALAQEESRHQELTSRKTTVETKKRDVEDVIMRGLSADPSAAHAQGAEGVNDAENGHRGVKEPERPQVEELTPPPMENFTPVGSPFPGDGEDDEFDQPAAVQALVNQATIPAIPAGLDLLSSLSVPAAHSYGKDSTNGGMLKKRKLDDETNFVNYAGGNDLDDLDADVEELLRSESGRK
jgi:regulator of Ty1 transposition protein 103